MLYTALERKMYEPILDRLYRYINLMHHRYQMMTDKNHIEEVRDYLVTPHIQGFNNLIFITQIGREVYHCIISKKELKFHQFQNNMDTIKINTFRCVCKRGYKIAETILDGKIIRNGTFMVYDAYYMMGRDVRTVEMRTKYTLIQNFINDINSSIRLDVPQLYDLKQIPEMITENVHKMNGLLFLPRYSKKWYIYVNDNEMKTFHNTPILNESEKEFIMKKTDIPDVYELFWECPHRGLIREGIAAIPNLRTSHFCRQATKSQPSINIKCVKSIKFNKWIPICGDVSELSMVLI